MQPWNTLRVAVLIAVLAAIAGMGLGAPATAVAQDEPLVFCSDIAYPPMEFFEGSTPVGADIDIATEVAKRMGREVEFTNVGFDGIVAALQSGLCDAIISGMNNTPERDETVDFVNYMKVGQSLVVLKGNPLGVATLEDLCGLTAGAQVGTTNLDTLNAASEACVEAGQEPIDVVGFPSDTDAVLALKTDRIDVYETDSSVAAYYIAQEPESFEFAGEAIGTIPVGIAVREDDPELRGQIQDAVNAMNADGTMAEILEKWLLGDLVLTGDEATPVASPMATPEAG